MADDNGNNGPGEIRTRLNVIIRVLLALLMVAVIAGVIYAFVRAARAESTAEIAITPQAEHDSPRSFGLVRKSKASPVEATPS